MLYLKIINIFWKNDTCRKMTNEKRYFDYFNP